jgi:uncharacterized protein YbjT (DUF2867 family)
MKKLIVIGGTGFTGRRLCPALKAAGIPFDALVRSTSDTSFVRQFADTTVESDIGDLPRLGEILRDYETCIHIPDLARIDSIDEYIAVFAAAGLRKAVFVSSTNMLTKLPARTKPRREAAERAIKNSGLNYVLIRPTMIYGGSDDRNVSRLIGLMKKLPLFPLFDGGRAMQQPIYIKDHAQALVDVLQNPACDRKCYIVSGPAPMSYREMVAQLAPLAGKKAHFVSIPVKPVYYSFRLLEKAKIHLPFRSEQLLRVVEDKAFGHDEATREFGFSPCSFAEGLLDGFGQGD